MNESVSCPDCGKDWDIESHLELIAEWELSGKPEDEYEYWCPYGCNSTCQGQE